MKVAIVHYWLLNMRGGEKVLEHLIDLYPQADLFTHVFDSNAVSQKIRKTNVKTTFISKLPLSKRHYQKYLPLMPRALEQLDLSDYDLIISSESGPAKGIIPGPNSLHICYCHSPMRYIWDHYNTYRNNLGPIGKLAFSYFAHRLRIWDVTSSARVDQFVCNSRFVQQRVKKFYRRESVVIHPPVEADKFKVGTHNGDYYLWAGELVDYKRPDLIVDAFNKNGKPLKILGSGPAKTELLKKAKNNIQFLGKLSDDKFRVEIENCSALIFPGEEDFGIIPVEAMSAGRPIIAYRSGGVLDTVTTKTGVFFENQSIDSLNKAIETFENRLANGEFNSQEISEHAKLFSGERFKFEFSSLVDSLIKGAS